MALADTSDPRVERSRAQLIDALAVLLRTRDPQDISISALCAQAGVSRQTFYQHFASIDEVAVAGIERRFAELRAELPDGPRTSYRLVVRFLEELDSERATWRRTIAGGTALSTSRDAVETWLADRLADREPGSGTTAVRYAAAGFLGAIRAWLCQEDGPDRPLPEQLAAELDEVSARVLSRPVARA